MQDFNIPFLYFDLDSYSMYMVESSFVFTSIEMYQTIIIW